MEDVKVNDRLIHVESGTWPLSLRNVRDRHPNISFPEEPSVEDMRSLGYEVIHPTTKPSGDFIVMETIPVQGEDDLYYQTWETRAYDPSEYQNELEVRRRTAYDQVVALEVRTFEKGFKYSFPNGTQQHVQLRVGDLARITGLRVAADAVIDGTLTLPGGGGFIFRTFEDNNVPMTAEEMVALTNGALIAYTQAVQVVWSLKDQIASAELFADLPEIPVVLIEGFQDV